MSTAAIPEAVGASPRLASDSPVSTRGLSLRAPSGLSGQIAMSSEVTTAQRGDDEPESVRQMNLLNASAFETAEEQFDYWMDSSANWPTCASMTGCALSSALPCMTRSTKRPTGTMPIGQHHHQSGPAGTGA